MARITEKEAGGRNVLAGLDMLAWAEGTDRVTQASRDQGYDVLVGGQLFNGYNDHPRILVDLPRLKIKSSAAGRYQLLGRYWDPYRKALKLVGGFTPENQDRVAIQQIREQGALGDLKAGRLKAMVEKCANIWASLPGAGYGQHEQKMDALVERFVAAGGVLDESEGGAA